MLDPPPMIEFLELRACSVRIKGRHALIWSTCSNSNTEQQYSIHYSGKTEKVNPCYLYACTALVHSYVCLRCVYGWVDRWLVGGGGMGGVTLGLLAL